MFQKGNRFYADWRDRRGARHRRAFTTAAEAEQFEVEQKQRNHPKRKGPADKSPRSSGPTSQHGRRGAKEQAGESRQCNTSGARSSKQRAIKRRAT